MERYACLTDQQLIVLISQEDGEAGNEIARRYYLKVMKVCMSFLRHPQDAQDAAQEVFLCVLAKNKVAKFRGESLFWTWLYRVTINACIQQNRKKRHVFLLGTFGTERVSAKIKVNITPADEAAKAETLEHMWQALNLLSDKYKHALLCVYFKNKSRQETACFLEVTIQALRMHIYRGKKLLANAYRRRIQCALHA